MEIDKQLKEKYRKIFSQNPEKYYPVEFLKNLNLVRGKCKKCGKFFWSTDPARDVCGDGACTETYSFLDKRVKRLNFTQTWKKFSKILKNQGYTEIKRYPVSARWRDDLHFVEASVDDFIPYVVSGEIKPPAKALIVPQFCLRFNDIANIGVTGAHYSLFTMIGQHRFETPKDYKPNEYLSHLYKWFNKGLGLNAKDLVFHEDFWAGSGNFGPCVEVFGGGLELANQVYMQYKQTANSYKELKLKVLDMGLGQERNCWFASNKINSYEAVFPTICSKLRKQLGLKFDEKLLKKFVIYSSVLNDTKDKTKTLQYISKKINVDYLTLKALVEKTSSFYSIIDHSRALLVAISDGVLPSNVGGGYNLRAIFRRSFDIIEQFNWNINISDLVAWHSKDLKKLHPELSENLDEIQEILRHERKKYFSTKKSAEKIISSIKKTPTESDLLTLYKSRGISPEMLIKSGLKIKVPDEFYLKLTENQNQEKLYSTIKKTVYSELDNLKETELLYRTDDYLREFNAKVVKSFRDFVVLDKTAFYPTSGGQAHDLGTINKSEIIDVTKINGIILHKIKGINQFKSGDVVHGEIEWKRRLQLMQHHTATHIINGVSRSLLGNHIWQAGAEKTVEKARLDLTHYEKLDQKTLKLIEKKSNDIIKQGVPIKKELLTKTQAEKKYGFRLYQGGAIPTNILRVVSIGELDTEACGGTHLNNTREVGRIKIIGSKKIQDGVIRIEFKAGEALEHHTNLEKGQKAKIAKLFDIKETEKINLQGISEIYSVGVNQILKTLNKFIREWNLQKAEIKLLDTLKEYVGVFKEIPRGLGGPRKLFAEWKNQKKIIDKLKKNLESKIILELSSKKEKVIEKKVNISDLGSLIRISKQITEKNPKLCVILISTKFVVGCAGKDSKISALDQIRKLASVVQGNSRFAKGFKLKGS